MDPDKVRSTIRTMLTHGLLSVELTKVEWEIEKMHLKRAMLLGIAIFMVAMMLLISICLFIVAIAWNTSYREWVMLSLVVLFLMTLVMLVRKWKLIGNRKAFPETRSELAADIAVLRNRLEL